jgi:uncharacterized protein VirK/YbjX
MTVKWMSALRDVCNSNMNMPLNAGEVFAQIEPLIPRQTADRHWYYRNRGKTELTNYSAKWLLFNRIVINHTITVSGKPRGKPLTTTCVLTPYKEHCDFCDKDFFGWKGTHCKWKKRKAKLRANYGSADTVTFA